MTTTTSHLRALATAALALAAALAAPLAEAITYSYASTPFNWIDASSHAKIGYNTAPAKFNGGGNTGCGTAPPILDDTISDPVPIGFNFNFAGVTFNQVRVMSNGRLHFNNATCGYGSPVTYLPYPQSTLNYTMRIYGNDLDPTLKGEATTSTYIDAPGTPCVNRAVCYVSYATVGTAPYRSFVVTWANVPEWVQGRNPIGSYNMQLILLENGEFIYQYGTDVAGPQAKNGEVGWQGGDTTDFDTPPAGFPINNTAIKFYIPAPVAEYRFEQPSKANSPAYDTSGNGYTGSMLGGVLTAAGKVCRAATIPSNTAVASIDAIDTTVPIQKIGGVGLIDFWYKSTTAWVGGKDEQLLDASVSAGVYFFLVKRSNGNLRFVITDTTGVHQVVETGAISVAANTWKHIAVSWNFNPNAATLNDKMMIYVDGARVATSSFTTSGYPAAQGTLYAGDNRSSVIGQNGTGNSADGAIDELRIYNSDGSGLVTRDYNGAALGCVNHYKIIDGPDGSTCQPSTVTVIAHDLNHANFTMPNNTTTVQLSTSTGRGDWTLVQGYGTLTNSGGDDGTASYLFNGEFQAVFALRHTVAGAVTVHASDGQLSDLSSENQAINMVACGSGSFNACMASTAPAIPRCVPTASSQAAATKNAYAYLPTRLAKTAFTLDLVKLKADGTLDTGFNKTVGVELLAYTNALDGATIDTTTLCPKPTAPPTTLVSLGNVTLVNGRAPSASGLTVAANALSAVAPGYSAFKDVRVRFTCDAANCGSATTTCSTDAFALRPADFTLTSDMVNTTRHAGTPFTLTATASVSGNAVTGYNGAPQIANNSNTSTGDAPNVILPSAYVSSTGATALNPCTQGANGSCTDALANIDANGNLTNNLAAATITTGASVNPSMRFEDIGYVGLIAGAVRDQTFTSVDQPYDCVANSSSNTIDPSTGLIGCNVANTVGPVPFGRFTVDHLELKSVLTNACAGFSYMDQQEFGISIQLSAFSLHGTLPLRRFATGTATVTGENTNAAGVVTTFSPLSTRLSPDIPSLAWNAGMAGRYYATDAVTHLAGSTSIKLTGGGTIAAGELVRFAGDPTKYTVSSGTTSAATPIGITPGLASDLASGAIMTTLHKFTRASTADGPYDGFALRMAGNEADGALITKINGTALSLPGVASVAWGTSDGDNGAVRLRYGRLRIGNAYGSEKLDLPVPVKPQYYSGATDGYITSTLDKCTTLTPASFTLSNYNPASTSANLPTANLTITPPTAADPIGAIKLLKPLPSPAITQKFNVRVNSAIPYLPGSGTETFGLFRAGPVIYMQEVH